MLLRCDVVFKPKEPLSIKQRTKKKTASHRRSTSRGKVTCPKKESSLRLKIGPNEINLGLEIHNSLRWKKILAGVWKKIRGAAWIATSLTSGVIGYYTHTPLPQMEGVKPKPITEHQVRIQPMHESFEDRADEPILPDQR